MAYPQLSGINMRNLSSPQGSRRPLPHLMSVSHNAGHPRTVSLVDRLTVFGVYVFVFWDSTHYFIGHPKTEKRFGFNQSKIFLGQNPKT